MTMPDGSHNNLKEAQRSFETAYAKNISFFKYPNEYLVKTNARYFSHVLEKGAKILDFGFGSGNNSVFFQKQGYDVYGIEVAASSKQVLEANFEYYGIDKQELNKFRIVDLQWKNLPFETLSFDLIVANQVLQYLSSREEIKSVCRKLDRYLATNGLVFFTMNCPKNISHRTNDKFNQFFTNELYEISDSRESAGYDGKQISLVRDEDDIIDLFSMFEMVTVGSHDETIFDQKNMKRLLFVGKKIKGG